jgi:hypothetical protein
MLEEAARCFEEYGVPKENYEFVRGDLFETIKQFNPGDFDVVFCFGFFHMHNRQQEMLRLVERLKPAYLVMDVWLLPFTNDPVTYLIPHVLDKDGLTRYTDNFSYPLMLTERTDKVVSKRDGAGLKFGREPIGQDEEVMLLAYPSQSALEWLLIEAGFGDLEYYDWKNADISDWNDLADYQMGQRVSLLAKNRRVC